MKKKKKDEKPLIKINVAMTPRRRAMVARRAAKMIARAKRLVPKLLAHAKRR